MQLIPLGGIVRFKNYFRETVNEDGSNEEEAKIKNFIPFKIQTSGLREKLTVGRRQ